MRKTSTFLGLLLVLAGLALMAGNLWQINLWPFLVPAALILLGVWFVIGSTRGGARLETEALAVARNGAARAKIVIRHGAGRLQMAGGAAPANLVDGTFTGGVRHTETRSGDSAHVDLSVPENVWLDAPWMFGPWTALSWDVRLNTEIPIQLEMQTGAGESQVDLSGVRAENIRLSTGASSTELTLPARAGRIRVLVESGAASVRIRVPDGVAARIAVESGLAGVHVDTARFAAQSGGFASAGFETATQAADIQIRTGVGAVDIR